MVYFLGTTLRLQIVHGICMESREGTYTIYRPNKIPYNQSFSCVSILFPALFPFISTLSRVLADVKKKATNCLQKKDGQVAV